MKQNIALCLVAMLVCALCSCGGVDIDRSLREAETELQAGDYQSVISRCAELSDSTRVHLDLAQKCRLAVIYGKLYDNTKDQSYASVATALFQKALEENPDSVYGFYDSLGIDDQGVAATLLELANALGHSEDRDFPHDEYPVTMEPDSITF